MENEVDDSLRKISTGAGLFFVGIVISKLLGYVYRVAVARISVEDYGLLNLALAIVGVVGIFALLGLNEGVLRYIPFYLGKNDKRRAKGAITSALKISVLLSIFFAALLFIFSEKIAMLFNTPQLGFIIKILAIIIPLDALRSIFFNVCIGFQKINYFIYSKNITENLVKVIFTIPFIYIGWGLLGAVYAYILAILASALLSIYFVKWKILPILGKAKLIEIKGKLLDYSWPLIFTSLLLYVIGWTDTFMIGYFKSVSDVGIYNAALPTAGLLFVIPLTLATIFFPLATQLYSKDKKEAFDNIYRTATKWLFLTNLFLLTVFLIFSKEVLVFIFGGNYSAGAFSLAVLSTGYFLSFMSKNSEKVLLVLEKSKLIFFNLIIASVVNVVLNYILIPKYGINGSAVATSISYVLVGILVLAESYYLTKDHPFEKSYLKIILGVLVSALIFFLIKPYLINVYLMIISFMVIFVLYLALLLLMKVFEREDVIVISTLQQKTGLRIQFVNKIIKKFL